MTQDDAGCVRLAIHVFRADLISTDRPRLRRAFCGSACRPHFRGAFNGAVRRGLFGRRGGAPTSMVFVSIFFVRFAGGKG
jgi:hypothetical protein